MTDGQEGAKERQRRRLGEMKPEGWGVGQWCGACLESTSAGLGLGLSARMLFWHAQGPRLHLQCSLNK